MRPAISHSIRRAIPILRRAALPGAVAVAVLLCLESAVAQPLPTGAPGLRPADAAAIMHDNVGRVVANVEFRQGTREVLVLLIPSDPPRLTGTHALQIHAVAACDAPDFLTA